jgi:ADP-ribose pyrophosphatase YjhB (NUDIX family)
MKGRGPYTGTYDLPGGSIEFGESPEDALRREVTEETGLRCISCQLTNTLSHIKKYCDKAGEPVTLHHIGIIYHADVDENEVINTTGDNQDSLGAAWHSLAEIDFNQLSPFAKAVVKEKLI